MNDGDLLIYRAGTGLYAHSRRSPEGSITLGPVATPELLAEVLVDQGPSCGFTSLRNPLSGLPPREVLGNMAETARPASPGEMQDFQDYFEDVRAVVYSLQEAD